MKRIKIKKFSNKSQSAAMKAYNLTNEEYDQVNAYIRENNISSDSTILVEETPDGIAISTCDADDNGNPIL